MVRTQNTPASTPAPASTPPANEWVPIETTEPLTLLTEDTDVQARTSDELKHLTAQLYHTFRAGPAHNERLMEDLNRRCHELEV